MKDVVKIAIVTVLIFLNLCVVSGQEVRKATQDSIRQQIGNLKKAHLNNDVALAEKLYHPRMILTSQSGKRYHKEVALLNIKNTFESYESSDIEFLKVSDDVVLTNYINERKYKDFAKGTFRLTVVWTTHKKVWKIISMQSSKINSKK